MVFALRFPSFDPIEYLVTAKFGKVLASKSDGLEIQLSPERMARKGGLTKQKLEEAAAYRRELASKSEEELSGLVSAEKLQQQFIAKIQAEAKEKSHSFNKPAAFANIRTYSYWVKAAYWNIDEATALFLGRNPERVKLKWLDSLRLVSTFAGEFLALHELMSRAVHMKQLGHQNSPGHVVAWVQRNRIEIPLELTAEIEAHGIQVADWKTCYDLAESKVDKLAEELQGAREANINGIKDHTEFISRYQNDHRAICDAYEQKAKEREAMIAELQETISGLAKSSSGKEFSPDGREQKTLLKLGSGLFTATIPRMR
ncbi:hypothetical protein [Pararhizobium sp. IMCC21322]|uniref:hypothetical protein n=1 Tax=Pararhizobium sp. IMCC21322 TaxID=3067903 RepID=UPI0027407B36|nr:hypothetical protein [Pararhizobium sp. IMCC21322]